MVDPVIVMNLAFDLIIMALALFVYGKKKMILVLWLAIAFSLFAISYVLTILELGSSEILIPLRAVGYLSIIAGLILQHRR